LVHSSHLLWLIVGAPALIDEVVCNYHLLVDVMGAFKVKVETPCLEVHLTHMAYNCSF